MLNLDKLQYTFVHRQAFRYVLDTSFADLPNSLYEELSYRAEIHDLDKSLFLTLGDRKEASAFHRLNAPHHMENNSQKTEADLYEALIDYECAGYTKPDKPMNAYDTIISCEPNHGAEMIGMLARRGLDVSYDNTPDDPDWQAYLAQCSLPTEENILEEIYLFCTREPMTANTVIWHARQS